MDRFPYDLTRPIGQKATLGLIVLQVDETIEQDFRRFFADPQIALYISRIPSGDDLNPDTIAQMETDLPAASRLLPPAAQFDVVGYACTSGTTLIGADRVAELIQANTQARNAANPLTAALTAMDALNVKNVGIVSPYISSVSEPIRQAFQAHGLKVPKTVSFGEEVEARVARIDPASIHAAALAVGGSDDTDAVFLSCTNLRTLDIIDELETELGKPVLSSNQVLAWHMARLAGGAPISAKPGQLFQI